jgi:hypothetical protein
MLVLNGNTGVDNSECRNDSGYQSSRLVRLMAERFTIYPVHSMMAYEEFSMSDGDIVRLTHHIFELSVTRSYSAKEELINCMWGQLKLAYPPGTFLMWRRLPVFQDDDHEVTLSLRIGSFVKPNNDVGEVK